MHFPEKVYNIQSAIQQLELPLVVKSENEYSKGASSNTSYEDTLRLQPSSINLLERKTAITFAQVTVMDFCDPDQIESERGINFIESHSEYEDENCLLPITYSGKCKIVHPPGKSKRYIDVSKLMEDLPRYVRVNDQLKLLDHDTMVTRVVSPGNKLEIVDIKAVANNRARSLICRNSENQKLLLKEGMLVNLTAVDDDASYTLTQLKDMKILLPKCIELQEVIPSDIVVSDDQDAHRVRVITQGPLKLLSFVKQEFVLSWCPSDSDSDRSTFNLALIPKRKWKNEKVKVRNFDSQDDKQQYTKKHFPGSKDSIFIKYKLYLLEDQDEPGIVYLQDRVPATQTTRQKMNDTRPAAILLEREPFPDSDTENYERVVLKVEPAPALPPKGGRRPPDSAVKSIKSEEKPTKQWQELKTWIGSVKHKLGLDKVHSEIGQMGSDIMKKLRHRKTPDRPPSLNPKLAVKPKPELKHSISMEAPVSAKTNLKRSQSSVADAKTWSLPSKYYYMEFETKTESAKESFRKDKKFATTRPSIINRPRLPIPEVCRADDSAKAEPQNNYEDIDDTDLQDKELQRVSCDGQTAEDFYGYSADQVVECFKLIALPDLAKLCEKEKINGDFFKGLSEDQIRTYFQFEPFHFIKVKKAIFDGWRPK